MTEGSNPDHSIDLFTFTRVTHKRKEAKRTVGATLPPHLISETRKRNLNISQMAEQAL